MIRQIAPVFFTMDIPGTLAYYKDKLGFECLATWMDPPVYAIVARDEHPIHFRCAAPHEHGANSLGSVHLVSANRKQMAADLADVNLDLSRALDGIDVEEDARVGGDFADFFDGLKHAGFIVGEHHADQACLRPDGTQDVGWIHEAAGLRGDEGRLHAVVFQLLCCLQNGRVLDRGR